MDKTGRNNWNLRNGIKYEEFYEFNNSFFKDVYNSAYIRLQDIINESEDVRNKQLCGKKIKRHQEFSNILTFIGKRGSGKTSAMLSFMESLRGYQDYEKQNDRQSMFYKFEQDRIGFTCLDCIDGSLLERGEDIFKIVLAQMYQRFLESDTSYEYEYMNNREDGERSYRYRELLESFENLFKIVCQMDRMSKDDMQAGESYMSNLRNLARSQEIKERFAKLVADYLYHIQQNSQDFQYQSKHQFLIVTVDDLDLNIQNGFAMLERIHRYLMVPNLIVLLALDYEQILLTGRKNFYKVLPKVDNILNEGMSNVQRVTIDYLEKVLPINYRVYMPEVIDFSISDNEWRNSKRKQKQLLFRTLLGKTGIAFDSQGLKAHFYEPKSIRMLTSFLLSLDFLKEANGFDKRGKLWKIEKFNITEWKRNYHFLKADLSARISTEKIILKEDKQFFERILETDVRRAMELVIDFGREEIRQYGKAELKQDGVDEIPKEYNYGILINTLYYLGRIKFGVHKPLIQCLIAYFSYEIFKVYLYENYNINGRYADFKEIVAGDVAGIWNEKMIPDIPMDREDKEIDNTSLTAILHANTLQLGTTDTPKAPKYLPISQKDRKVFQSFFDNIQFYDDQDRELRDEKIKKYIIKNEILFMSLNNFQFSDSTAGGHWEAAIEERHTQRMESVTYLDFYYETPNQEKIRSIAAQYDIFAFIENSLMWKNTETGLKSFEDALVKAMEAYYGMEKESFPKQGLLVNQYQKWSAKYRDSVPFPIYWMDMSYNIIKRAKRNAIKNNPKHLSKTTDHWLKYVKMVYQDLAMQLEEQERFYNEEGRDGLHIDISEKFENCPYVKCFLENEAFHEIEDFFEGLTVKLLQGV